MIRKTIVATEWETYRLNFGPQHLPSETTIRKTIVATEWETYRLNFGPQHFSARLLLQ
jgi:NADH:ubiquinone oxidoreductase subunit D